MISHISHIGIAVHSLERSLAFWAEALGLEVTGIETVESEKVKVAFLQTGDSRIELLEPTADDSAVSRFLAKRGEGIHHLALGSRELPTLLERLGERGVSILGNGPRPGAGGSEVAFLHPKTTGGVLLELVGCRETVPEPTRMAPGSAVLLYLHEPQEKLWGVLRQLDSNGVVIEGLDLGSFDDWVAQVERGEESVVGPSVLFVPMARLEKILLDRSSGELPSLAERFRHRTGRRVQDVLGASGE